MSSALANRSKSRCIVGAEGGEFFAIPQNRNTILVLVLATYMKLPQGCDDASASHCAEYSQGEDIMGNNKSAFKEVTGASIGWAVVMILLGLAAVFLPLASGIAVSIVVSWLIVFAGVAYLASAFAGRNAGAFIWRVLIGLVYVAGGGYLAFHPALALESLTVVMAAIFAVEGVLEIVTFFQSRAYSGSGWVLFDGMVTLLLAYLIVRPWPSSSAWAIGTILGINLISSGFSVLMYSLAARRTLEALSS
jgi:uncharacterized membrane protein HdeD (DUF308 family)